MLATLVRSASPHSDASDKWSGWPCKCAAKSFMRVAYMQKAIGDIGKGGGLELVDPGSRMVIIKMHLKVVGQS